LLSKEPALLIEVSGGGITPLKTAERHASAEETAPDSCPNAQAVTMQLNEGPLNRRDAKSAEKDQSQPVEDLSLKGDWVEGRYPRSFLSALCVSAVPWHTPSLSRNG